MLEHQELFPLPEAVMRTQMLDEHLASMDWQTVRDFSARYPFDWEGVAMVIAGLKPAFVYGVFGGEGDPEPFIPPGLRDRIVPSGHGWLVDIPAETAIMQLYPDQFPDADPESLTDSSYVLEYVRARTTILDEQGSKPEELVKTGLLLGFPFRSTYGFRRSFWSRFRPSVNTFGYGFSADSQDVAPFRQWHTDAVNQTGIERILQKHQARVDTDFLTMLRTEAPRLDIISIDGMAYMENFSPEPENGVLIHELLPMAPPPYTETAIRHLFDTFNTRCLRRAPDEEFYARRSAEDFVVPVSAAKMLASLKKGHIPYMHLEESTADIRFFPKTTDAGSVISFVPEDMRSRIAASLGA